MLSLPVFSSLFMWSCMILILLDVVWRRYAFPYQPHHCIFWIPSIPKPMHIHIIHIQSHNPPRNILYKVGAVRGALFGVILPGSQFFPKNTIFKSRCPPGTRNVSTITILYCFPLYINDNSWVCTKNRPRRHNY